MNNVPDPLMALNSQFSIVTLDDFCAEIVEDPPPLETVCVYSLGMIEVIKLSIWPQKCVFLKCL